MDAESEWPIAICALAWVAGLAIALSLDDPRLRYPIFLAAGLIMVLPWWALGSRARANKIGARALRLLLLLGALARILALLQPPAFSDDVFRLIFEGRSVWAMGPSFPILHTPAEAPALGVPPELLDSSWLRINHPELPTIYPPLSAAIFALAAGIAELLGGGHLVVLKAIFLAADLGSGVLISRALKASGRPESELLWWALCPLAVLEVSREGHGDALAMLGLALAIDGFLIARPRLGFLGSSLAALAKLVGLVMLLPAIRATRRGLAPLLLLGLLALPFLWLGPAAGTSLAAYATRWRSGDGAFSLVLLAAQAILGGDYRSVFGVTVTQHQLARALIGLGFATFAAVQLVRPIALAEVPEKAGLLLLAVLLLTPSFHPWYALWLLPFVPFLGAGVRPAALWLLGSAWLLHHPGYLELLTGQWTDLGWVRALVHLPAWLFLAARWRRSKAA